MPIAVAKVRARAIFGRPAPSGGVADSSSTEGRQGPLETPLGGLGAAAGRACSARHLPAL